MAQDRFDERNHDVICIVIYEKNQEEKEKESELVSRPMRIMTSAIIWPRWSTRRHAGRPLEATPDVALLIALVPCSPSVVASGYTHTRSIGYIPIAGLF